MIIQRPSQDEDASLQVDHQLSQDKKKQSPSAHPAGSLLRLILVTTLVTTGLFFSLLGTGSPVHAATDSTSTQSTTPASTSTLTGRQKFNQLLLQLAAKYTVSTTAPSKAQTVNKQVVKPLTTSTGYNGLGDLPFYSYVDSKQLTATVGMKINVANGNVLLHTSELSIHGTGINIGLGSQYNSEDNGLLDDGNLWYFDTGRGVTLDLSNLSSGITLHGPSGYSAFFKADSKKSSGFDDAIGLNASIAPTGNSTYTITFHQSGEQWGFNQYGSFLLDGDKNGNSVQYSYGSNGDLNTIIDTQGRTITFNQGTDANNNLHQVTSYGISTSDGTSKTITHTYTAFNLTGVTDANLQTTTFQYDSSDRITKITNPLNHSTSYAYNSAGQIATVTDAINGTTQFAYDASTASACSGIEAGTTADPNLPCTVVTDANGHSTTYAYNSNLQVTHVKDALGHVTTQAFDSTNYNVTSQADALSDTSSFTFDASNNLKTSTDGSGAITSFGYPAATQSNPYYPTSQKDPQQNTTSYAYDGNGNLTTATNTTSSSTGTQLLSYTYNDNGTIASQKDANNNVTAYSYDSQGNLTTVTPPAPMGKTTITYDQLSRVSSEKDGKGNTTSYRYDNDDRITTISYQDGSRVSYTYDPDGNVLSEIDSTGTTTFTYDTLNRILTKTLPGGTVETNAYDTVGNLTSLNDGTGTTTYSYDVANRMITLKDPSGGVSHYGYDNANRKTSILYPNGTGMLLTYDKAGRELTDLGGKVTSSNGTPQITGANAYVDYVYTYTTGSANTQTSLLQTEAAQDPTNAANQFKWSYSYDTQNRLSSAVKKVASSGTINQQWSLSYDANGNLTNKTYSGASNFIATYNTYNADNEPTTATSSGNYAGNAVAGSATYTYDANGNETAVTNSGTTEAAISFPQTHTYNSADQDVSGSGKVNGVSATYTYGYSGTNQTDRVTNGTTSSVYTTLGLSSEKTSATNTNEYVRCSCGLLNSERTSAGKEYYYLFDGRGSVVGMTDSSGNDVDSYGYDPFGALAAETVQSGINNPWQFESGYYDSATGLTKFGIRYYDPQFGRWTQATPVGGSLQEATKANPYVYAGDNSINNVDPSGKSWGAFTGCLGSVGAVIGGIAATVTGLVGGIVTAVGSSAAASAASAAAWATITEDATEAGLAAFAAADAAATVATGAWILVGAAVIAAGVVGTCAIIGATH